MKKGGLFSGVSILINAIIIITGVLFHQISSRQLEQTTFLNSQEIIEQNNCINLLSNIISEDYTKGISRQDSIASQQLVKTGKELQKKPLITNDALIKFAQQNFYIYLCEGVNCAKDIRFKSYECSIQRYSVEGESQLVTIAVSYKENPSYEQLSDFERCVRSIGEGINLEELGASQGEYSKCY